IDLAIIGGEVPPELQDSLEIAPYAEDELALIMPVFHPLAGNETIARSDLYKLKFITLDSQSTIRKVIDQVLTRGGIETRRLRVEMELNSIEAIKNAVQSGLGVAFASTSSIEKELQMCVIHRARIESVEVKRTLSVIFNPNRYRSKAAEAFTKEILPQFTNRELEFRKASVKTNGKANGKAVDSATAQDNSEEKSSTTKPVANQDTSAKVPDKAKTALDADNGR
ncbi:MAG: LysR substrate-binding domain-containing protein, partial [Cyanobacteria bacterium P01_C01_bin.121]